MIGGTELSNLHYLFHHDYYCNPAKSNEVLTRQSFQASASEIPFAEQSFVLKTQYPGLLLGLGYPHDDGSGSSEAVKLGCSLDYVSGLPVIPGSTVKGVLRSLFKRKEAHEYIQALAEKDLDIDALEKELFTEDGEDVFFDAYPVTPGQLLAFESITPHDEKGLKNPIPIKLLKVRPGVEFLFRFRLKNEEGQQLSVDEKLKLFEALLMITGIGAKTNVGFGGLEPGAERGQR